jgi:hypothetical protein
MTEERRNEELRTLAAIQAPERSGVLVKRRSSGLQASTYLYLELVMFVQTYCAFASTQPFLPYAIWGQPSSTGKYRTHRAARLPVTGCTVTEIDKFGSPPAALAAACWRSCERARSRSDVHRNACRVMADVYRVCAKYCSTAAMLRSTRLDSLNTVKTSKGWMDPTFSLAG